MKSNFVQMNHFSIRPEFCLLNWTVLRGMSKSAHQSLKKGSLKKSSLMTVLVETAMFAVHCVADYWHSLFVWVNFPGRSELTGSPEMYTVHRQHSSYSIFRSVRPAGISYYLNWTSTLKIFLSLPSLTLWRHIEQFHWEIFERILDIATSDRLRVLDS